MLKIIIVAERYNFEMNMIKRSITYWFEILNLYNIRFCYRRKRRVKLKKNNDLQFMLKIIIVTGRYNFKMNTTKRLITYCV